MCFFILYFLHQTDEITQFGFSVEGALICWLVTKKKNKKFNISLNFPKTKAVFTLIIFLRFKKQEKKKQQLIKNQKTQREFDNCEPHAAGVSLKSQMAPQVQ